MTQTSEFRFIAKAGKGVRLPTAIRDAAFQLGLKLTLDVEKRWLSESIRGSVVGPSGAIDTFCNWWSTLQRSRQEAT